MSLFDDQPLNGQHLIMEFEFIAIHREQHLGRALKGPEQAFGWSAVPLALVISLEQRLPGHRPSSETPHSFLHPLATQKTGPSLL
jgi:hypothetical protein